MARNLRVEPVADADVDRRDRGRMAGAQRPTTLGSDQAVPAQGGISLSPEPQSCSRNLSARVMLKSASSFAAPRRVTRRLSDTDLTSSHLA